MRAILLILIFAGHAYGQFPATLTSSSAAAGGGYTWNPSAAGTRFTVGTGGNGANSLMTASGGTGTGSVGEVRATGLILTGTKMFFEVIVTTADIYSGNAHDGVIGIDNGGGNLNQYTGQNVSTWGAYSNADQVSGIFGYHSEAGVGTGGGGYAIGDVIDILVDLVTDNIYCYKNGVLNGTTTITHQNYYPAAGTGSHGLSITEYFYPNTPAYTYAGYTQY